MREDLLTTDGESSEALDRRWSPWPAASDPLSAAAAQRWVWFLLALGVAARLIRFGLRFPLWPDEAYLSASLIDRGYCDFFRPLEYHQVCPLLFLWAQLTAVKLFGFSEYSLRLVPLVCGLASLWVFRHLAGLLLRGTARVFAVGIFAVGYPGLRYAAEAKQYGCELLVSLLMITLFVRWQRDGDRNRWLWLLAAFGPLALGLSYPAVFVAGGVSAAVAWCLWQQPRRSGWAAWVAWNAVVLASFLAYYAVTIRVQNAELGEMRAYWDYSFPPVQQPLRFVGWLVATHSGEMFAHPLGGPRGGSIVSLLCIALAVAALWRRGERGVLALGAVTLLLNFTAALLHRYPYAGHIRMALYLGPIVCLLVGLGGAILLAQIRIQRRRRVAMAGLAALALLPLVSVLRDFAHPMKTASDSTARDFARWFWLEKSRDAELVCVKRDLGLDFAPHLFEYDRSSLYLCNQAIYSPRHQRHEAPHLKSVNRQRPLRCVLYHAEGVPEDAPRFDAWLASMNRDYEIVDRCHYPQTWTGRKRGEVVHRSSIETIDFRPRLGAGTPPDLLSRQPAPACAPRHSTLQ